MLNVHYFSVLKVQLGGLLFMKFKVNENRKYCVSQFICSLISIYTFHLHESFFDLMSKQTKDVKKNNQLSHIGGWRICMMLQVNFMQVFREKIYSYLKWVNRKHFIYLLWTSNIIQLYFWFKKEILEWLTVLDLWKKS